MESAGGIIVNKMVTKSLAGKMRNEKDWKNKSNYALLIAQGRAF